MILFAEMSGLSLFLLGNLQLTNLYSAFDHLVDQFAVYKVEVSNCGCHRCNQSHALLRPLAVCCCSYIRLQTLSDSPQLCALQTIGDGYLVAAGDGMRLCLHGL